MSRTPPKVREAALSRVLAGESAAAVARDIGVLPATVRSWRRRARNAPSLELVQPVDLSKLSPLEVLEHDIAATRRRLIRADDAGVFSALAPLTVQLRKMESEAAALRAAQVEDRADTDAERIEVLTAHMRCVRWVSPMVADRQARMIIRRVLAQFEAEHPGAE